MAKTRKSNTEFEMNTGANESVAKASMKKKTESTATGLSYGRNRTKTVL